MADPISLAIGGASLLSGLFNRQKAPETVPYTPVDVGKESRTAIESNLQNQDSIEQLLSRSNRYTQGEANSLMEQAIPGWSKLQKRYMDTTMDLLDNPYAVPDDVSKNLERLAAERGISTGTRGEFNDFSLLRDFGVNSLEYGASRIGQAQSITSLIGSLSPRVNPMSPASFYVSPETAIGTATANSQGAQGVAQGGANARAAASNANRNNLWSSLATAGLFGADAFMNRNTGAGGTTSGKSTTADGPY